MSDKHGWNDWNQYFSIPQRCIENYLNHFVLDDQLTATPTKTQVQWKGTLYCRDGIEIVVRKLQLLESRHGRPHVRTIDYSYHVVRRTGGRTINLFRYDNVHPHPGHPTPHHYHAYTAEGNAVQPATHVGEEGWPTLSEVIEQAHQLWMSGQPST